MGLCRDQVDELTSGDSEEAGEEKKECRGRAAAAMRGERAERK